MSKLEGNSQHSAPVEKYTITEHRISTCFEKCNYQLGDAFHARISQIYDPSKFWMVSKYRELDVFQKYMFLFYYTNGKNYKINVDEIVRDLYCVVFTDNAYYRGVIVGFSCGLSAQPHVVVHFIDYGMVKTVQQEDLYYMTEKCHAVPQFAIRATLAGVCPLQTLEWTSDDAFKFHELIINKILVVDVLNVDQERHVIEVHIADKSDNVPIHDQLIAQKRARLFHQKPELVENKLPFRPKLTYPYLFPAHEALESGKLPTKLCDAEYGVQFGCLSSVLGRYYEAGSS